jgi:hypothetical protein
MGPCAGADRDPTHRANRKAAIVVAHSERLNAPRWRGVPSLTGCNAGNSPWPPRGSSPVQASTRDQGCPGSAMAVESAGRLVGAQRHDRQGAGLPPATSGGRAKPGRCGQLRRADDERGRTGAGGAGARGLPGPHGDTVHRLQYCLPCPSGVAIPMCWGRTTNPRFSAI